MISSCTYVIIYKREHTPQTAAASSTELEKRTKSDLTLLDQIKLLQLAGEWLTLGVGMTSSSCVAHPHADARHALVLGGACSSWAGCHPGDARYRQVTSLQEPRGDRYARTVFLLSAFVSEAGSCERAKTKT